MSNVQFNEGQSGRRVSTSGGLTGWLLKKGWVKTKQQAQLVLLGVAVVAIVLAFIFFTGIGDAPSDKPPFDPDTVAPDTANFE